MEIKDVNSVCLLGFGFYGGGIAQVCASQGYEVRMYESNKELLDNGIKSIRKTIVEYYQKKSKLFFDRITGTTDLAEAVKNVDIIIEAVPEDLEIKKKTLAEAERYAPERTIFVSTVYSLMIAEIAEGIERKDKLIGMHWFYPPQKMVLVEIARGMSTSKETYDLIYDFSLKLRKVPVSSKDVPGFTVARLTMVFMSDAIRYLEEGLMSMEELDQACKLGLNHPMGPFELMDLLGLDIVLGAFKNIYERTGDSRFHPPLLLRKMVLKGDLGRKSGKGFYEYNDK